MLFNTAEFIFYFLPCCILLFLLAHKKYKDLILLFFSILFYSIWSFKYFLVLFSSICINYFIGKKVFSQDYQNKKLLFYSGIIFNLSLLGYFKYTNFFIGNINFIFSQNISFIEIVLPLAISFYSFQQIAFISDCYHGKIDKLNFREYFLFVTFFPQLIAGPIVHHKEIMPNIKNIKVSFETFSYGISYFSSGLFKKVILADKFAEYADPMFNLVQRGDVASSVEAWIGVLSYTLQIYFDFSGYSDMAIGLGKIFNLNIPINFNSPYKSKNIVEFWRNWHITLSRFLRDYLYIPLGGNRKGKLRRYVNLCTTMLLGGLWHGASWNFVIWGALHGTYLIICHVLDFLKISLPKKVSHLFTFLAVVFAWIFFRASDTSSALSIINSLIGLNGHAIIAKFSLLNEISSAFVIKEFSYVLQGKTQLLLILLGLVTCFVAPNSQEIMKNLEGKSWAPSIPRLAFFSLLLTLSILKMSKVNSFIYFQF